MTPKKKEERKRIFSIHLERYHREGKEFLHSIVTGDESWLYLEKPIREPQWVAPGGKAKPIAKPSLHPAKVMLCVWFDDEGLVHYEIIRNGVCFWWDEEDVERSWQIPDRGGKRAYTLNAEVYAAQLERLRVAISTKRSHKKRRVILLHDNARPHVAKAVLCAIEDKRWEVLEHPPYSCTESPPDYHFFLSYSDWRQGKRFDTLDEVVDDFKSFVKVKERSFYERGIHLLPSKWEAAIDFERDYPTD